MKKILLIITICMFFSMPVYSWPTKGVSVSSTVSQTDITDSVFVLVEFNAVNVNVDGTWDGYTHSWEPGITGWACLTASVFVTGEIEDGQNIELHLFRNGESYKSFHMSAAGHGAQSIALNVEWYANNAGDIYNIQIFQRNSTGKVLTINDSGGAWPQTCYASFSFKD